MTGKEIHTERDDKGIMRYSYRIWVPNVQELKDEILDESHSSRYFIHPGSTKMYRDLKEYYWWPNMKRDVAEWITIDFVVGLPRTKANHDAIWVIIDGMTKLAHFIPINERYIVDRLVDIYLKEIVTRHGVLASIVSDRDPRFNSRFWRSFQECAGTKLNMSTTYHPQTDRKSERTIQTLEDMLRVCTIDFKGSWDDHFPLIEFSYNNSFHASIRMPPYEALYGRRCRYPLYWDEVGERRMLGPEVVQRTKDIVDLIRGRLVAVHDRQKKYADLARKDKEYEVGDLVLLKVSPWKGLMSLRMKPIHTRVVKKRVKRRDPLAPRVLVPIQEESFELPDQMETSSERRCREHVPADPPDPVHIPDQIDYPPVPKYIPDALDGGYG
ncbi:hypothetical protein AgCh_033846 [Apium graveolens]